MREGYDYIVVGGGSAGCIVASELSANPDISVLLLEAGPRPEAVPETLHADGYKHAFANDRVILERFSQPQAHARGQRLFMGSGRGLGGSGSVNGMVYTRGAREDWDEWPAPWHWEAIVPAFEALEARLRVRPRPPTRFTEAAIAAAEENGFRRKEDLNDGDLSGVIGYETMNYQDQERRSSYVAFLREALERPNLEVVTGALAERIVLQERRAVAVVWQKDRCQHTTAVTGEVVLAAGALESPKLLMLSGVGPRHDLQRLGIPVVHNLPQVGENLHDHPNVTLFFKGQREVDCSYPQLYGFHRANPESDLPKGQSDSCYVMYPARSSFREAAMRMLPTKLPARLYGRLAKRAVRALIAAVFAFGVVRRFIARTYGVVVILGKPKSRGRLWLESADPHVQAGIDPAYLSHPEDRETLLRAVELAQRMCRGTALQSWGARPLLPGPRAADRTRLARFVEQNLMTTFHYAGTCRMGEDTASVVDPELSVRGLANVRVADASVTPWTPVSAMNAPSMLVGFRAAQWILQARAEDRAADDPSTEARSATVAAGFVSSFV